MIVCTFSPVQPRWTSTPTLRYNLLYTYLDQFTAPEADVKATIHTIRLTLTFVVCTILLVACGGGGGGDRQVTGLPVPTNFTDITTLAAQSDSLLGSTEVFYRIQNATAGDFYTLEIFAARRNQTAWESNATMPLLRIYRPGATAGTMDLYLEHDFTGDSGGGIFGWNYYGWGKQDLDIPLIRIPANGNYFISVSTDDLGPGSDFTLRLKNAGIAPDITPLNTDNTTVATAFDISGGATVYDHYADAAPNYYTITEAAPTIACFEVSAFRNGRFMGDPDYFDPTLVLYDGSTLADPVLADGLSDFDIDDYLFSDPRFCYKLAAGSYLLEVNDAGSDGSSDYVLTYTADTTIRSAIEGIGGTGITNNTSATAEPLAYGDTVIEDVGGTDEDWFKFTATPGDLLELQIFDTVNAHGSTDGVYVEILPPSTASVLWASAPAAVSSTPLASTLTKYSVTGPGALTIRTILNADAASGSSSNDYYLRFTPQGATTDYTFSLRAIRSASFGAINGYTVEQDNTLNNGMGPTSSEDLDQNGYGAGIIGLSDTDTFQFVPPAAGTLVTVNVYAKEPATAKAHDLDGFGSTLQPVVTVYNNTLTQLTQASYTNTVAAEGITEMAPTLSVSYLSQGDAINYIHIASETPLVASDYPAYFIEVIPDPTP